MTENKSDLGEKALGKIVELGINSQLDEAENLDVVIRTDPIKLVQGKVDSVDITGEGLVMKQDLRVESVNLSTNSVEINPVSLAFGKVELTQSTDAQAQIVLTESDLNRALASDYLLSRMQKVEVQVDKEQRAVSIQQVQINLLDSDQISIKADLFSKGSPEKIGFVALAKASLQDDGQRIALEIISAEGQGLSLVLAKALFEKIMELLEFRNFDIEGMTFRLKQLQIQKDRMLIQATSVINQLPSL